MSVYPSYYEGWGLPVAESLSFGKVSLASTASSLPEVGGQFADYFSPNSAPELLDLIVKYTNKKNRQDRQQFIKTNYQPVTWPVSLKRLAQTVKP